MSAKPEFIEAAKAGNILARKCTKCDELHLATVYFCKKCGSKEFEDSILKGAGKVATYTIMTVPPAGFEDLVPYAWVVIELDDSDLRVSGFLPNIKKPEDLPIGAAVKVADFDDRGIVLKKL
ncbi:MAG: OB-fold domain-containing protein [Thermoproteota archaeon]|nr:OB-fold domain-containing protein [Thermoproteota archaeon]